MAEDEQPVDGDAAAQPKQKHKITYDKYIKMVNLFVQRVNDDESGTGDGVDGETLVEWYLEQQEPEMEGEEDYHREKALASMVLRRMVRVSHHRRVPSTHTGQPLLTYTPFAGQHPHGPTRRRPRRRRSRRVQLGRRGTHSLCPAPQLRRGGILKVFALFFLATAESGMEI
jgi:DNA replication licensing factor MCM6